MKIHEYQAKEIFKNYGISVPNGALAQSIEEAVIIAKNLKSNAFVLKAQIHAGGRGKAGGIKIAKTINEVSKFAQEILEKKISTKQTGNVEKSIKKILVEEAIDIDKELYLACVVDRIKGEPVILTSTYGGMEIEEIAHENIFKEHISDFNLPSYKAKKLASLLKLNSYCYSKYVKCVQGLYKAFIELDASLIEINPLVITKQNDVVALDAKINFDENALFRHKELLELRDITEEEESEVIASQYGLSYVRLAGNIGCLVNGAGLAMATMDIIKLHNGEPANFLDVGGGASVEQVKKGFKIILSDKNVKAILVNIFGGIMKCDVIANGIVEASKSIKLNVPLVIRLEGTNVELGKKILEKSGLNITNASNMEDAAKKVTGLIQ
jgi:succinyl-CoA synthetase beta subunit